MDNIETQANAAPAQAETISLDPTPTAEPTPTPVTPVVDAPTETVVVKKAHSRTRAASSRKTATKTATKTAKAPKATKVKRTAGVKAQGQVHKEAFRLLKAEARERGVKPAEIVRLAVHKFVGFKE